MHKDPRNTSLRTNTCAELRPEQIDNLVKLCGWVESVRDHGGLLFFDLRDRWGLTQVVCDPSKAPDAHAAAAQLRPEYVVEAAGTVEPRPEGTVNPDLPTGTIEVAAASIRVLAKADTPPFEVLNETNVSDELRMKYRYIDLRRRPMIDNLTVRHKIAYAMRTYFNDCGFLEIETPGLTKSTPEGARDFIVPSRINPGRFYALPQSPQLLKQILMVSGMDRYFQIVKCYRDEDLRADRQLEHTQLDMEMSFVDETDIQNTIEGMLAHVFEQVKGITLETPFPRLAFEEAMDRYGTDKPDRRFELLLADFSDLAATSEFKVFRGAVEAGGRVKGINATGCAKYSRKQIDELTAYVGDFGAKGLAWFKSDGGALTGPIAKFFDAAQLAQFAERLGAKDGDLLLFVADNAKVVNMALDRLRQRIARTEEMYDPHTYRFCWITGYPLFEEDDEKGITPAHHAFCSPLPEDVDKLETEPLAVRARTFDLVVNGVELGSGSIRINDPELQQRVLSVIGIDEEDAKAKFGFLMEAYRYGGPPHGGIGFGLDRFVALLQGLDNIREVIAFPKTTSGICQLTDAPSAVDPAQLEELKIQTKK